MFQERWRLCPNGRSCDGVPVGAHRAGWRSVYLPGVFLSPHSHRQHSGGGHEWGRTARWELISTCWRLFFSFNMRFERLSVNICGFMFQSLHRWSACLQPRPSSSSSWSSSGCAGELNASTGDRLQLGRWCVDGQMRAPLLVAYDTRQTGCADR